MKRSYKEVTIYYSIEWHGGYEGEYVAVDMHDSLGLIDVSTGKIIQSNDGYLMATKLHPQLWTFEKTNKYEPSNAGEFLTVLLG